MPRLGHIKLAATLAVGALLAAPPAHATGRPAVAALQVTLRHHHVYRGPVDGVVGVRTTTAVMRFQRRHGLTADGVVGPKTRRAFGRFARHVLGSRPLTPGLAGWDVAEPQFALAWHGFPSGAIDGGFGRHTERALIKFQRWAHLTPDGVTGPGTFRALTAPLPRCPIAPALPYSRSRTAGAEAARCARVIDISGKRYLLPPAPPPVPPEVLAAISHPVAHHRGPQFNPVHERCLARLREVFRTQRAVLLFA